MPSTDLKSNLDIHAELDYFRNLLQKNVPFSLIRFGDGEVQLMRDQLTRNPEWTCLDSKTSKALHQALSFKGHNFYQGIPCGCLEDRTWYRKYLFENISLHPQQLTFSTLFLINFIFDSILKYPPYLSAIL